MLLTTASLVVAFCSDFALYDTCHFEPFPSCCVGYAHRTSKARSALDQNSLNAYLLINVEAGCELHVMTFSFLEGGIGLRHNFLLSILRVKSAVISRTMYFWVATMRSTTHQRNRWLQLMRVSCFQGLSWGVRSRRCASSWPIIHTSKYENMAKFGWEAASPLFQIKNRRQSESTVLWWSHPTFWSIANNLVGSYEVRFWYFNVENLRNSTKMTFLTWMFALIANLIGPNRTWLIRWTIFASLLGYKGDTMHARATIDVRVPPVGVLWMKVESESKSSRIFVPFCPWKLQDAIDQRLYYIISSIRSSDEDASHFCCLIEATKHNTGLFLLLTLIRAE